MANTAGAQRVDSPKANNEKTGETANSDSNGEKLETTAKLGTLRDFIAQERLKMRKEQKKPPLGFWEQVVVYIYNPEEPFGRSVFTLLKAIVFHVYFYGAVVGLAFLLANFHPDISQHERLPHYRGHDSFFEDDVIPLNFLPTNAKRSQGLLVRFNSTRETWENYAKQLKEFVETENEHPEAITDCSGHDLNTEWKDGDKSCKVYRPGGDLSDWGPCTPESGFGYAKGTPCILLKLNRALMWKPQPLTDNADITDFIQNDLNYNVENVPFLASGEPTTRNLLQSDRVVCMSCRGESGFDQEMIGLINYYPSISPSHPTGPCISLYYFPFMNQPHYRSPFVFVEFADLPRNIMLQVRCTAFNTAIKRDVGIGTLSFELLVGNYLSL